jgi:hypothetical protein
MSQVPRGLATQGSTLRYCVDCGAALAGAFCGQCGRQADGVPPRHGVVDASAPAAADPAGETVLRVGEGVVFQRSMSWAESSADGRLCVPCRSWVAGAGPCLVCGAMQQVDDEFGRNAATGGLRHVNALDRASRGSPVRAFLSADDILLKAVLAVLALIGLVVAVRGIAGVVLVGSVALLAVVPASIAEGRGGRRLAWYTYGVLIFPVAVAHALMLPTPEAPLGDSSGDRQLRAVVGGAAALFITLAVAWLANGLVASDSDPQDTSSCYELSAEAGAATNPADAAALDREAAACLEGQ